MSHQSNYAHSLSQSASPLSSITRLAVPETLIGDVVRLHIRADIYRILTVDHSRAVMLAIPHLLRALPALIHLDLDLDSDADPAVSLTALASHTNLLTLKISAWTTIPALELSL